MKLGNISQTSYPPLAIFLALLIITLFLPLGNAIASDNPFDLQYRIVHAKKHSHFISGQLVLEVTNLGKRPVNDLTVSIDRPLDATLGKNKIIHIGRLTPGKTTIVDTTFTYHLNPTNVKEPFLWHLDYTHPEGGKKSKILHDHHNADRMTKFKMSKFK